MTTKSTGSIIYYDSDGGPILREVTAADVAALEQAYRAAAAIMRSQPVGVPPRLVQAWREAQQAVEGVMK